MSSGNNKERKSLYTCPVCKQGTNTLMSLPNQDLKGKNILDLFNLEYMCEACVEKDIRYINEIQKH